jgi:NAD(P)-dependent dehydrogenase (short-subunit alcohol dehydrogenase family)
LIARPASDTLAACPLIPGNKKVPQTILILGASRGLGLGLTREFLSRGFRVIATARQDASKLDALAQDAGANLRVERVDITDRNELAALRRALAGETLDVLFVNAGIRGSVPTPLHDVSPEDVTQVFLTNTYYPIVAAEMLADLVKPAGVFAFMSSRLGSVELNNYGQWETYRISKDGLNMGARSFFWRHKEHPVLSIAPGWVRTDMGGPNAEFDVETSCRNVANAVAAHAGKPGHRYVNYDGAELAW